MGSMKRRQHRWSWLLALLLLGTVAGAPVTPLRWARSASRCGVAVHACCCAKPALTKCACSGHDGIAAQLASLTACSGAKELPASVLAMAPALLPAAPSLLTVLRSGRAAPVAALSV